MVSDLSVHDAASCQMSRHRWESNSLRPGGASPLLSALLWWERWRRKDINWVMPAVGESLLEELTQQHCCFNPGGARLLPGNLWADSDSAFRDEVGAVKGALEMLLRRTEAAGRVRLQAAAGHCVEKCWQSKTDPDDSGILRLIIWILEDFERRLPVPTRSAVTKCSSTLTADDLFSVKAFKAFCF